MKDLDFTVLLPFGHLVWGAIGITLKIGILAFISAVLIAIVVGSLRARKLPKFFSGLLAAYVEFFRGTPLLVQLFVVYYGLPSFGVVIDPIVASVVTMGFNSGAYLPLRYNNDKRKKP